MEYCSHLWAGALHYQLDPFDRMQRRAVRIVGDPMICAGLHILSLRRHVSSLCVLYRVYHEECSEELFDLLLAAEFLTTVRFRKNFFPRATQL